RNSLALLDVVEGSCRIDAAMDGLRGADPLSELLISSMRNAYIALVLLVAGIAVLYGGIALLAAPSVRFGNYLERLQWEQGKSAYTVLKDDLPFEVASIHKEVFELAPRNNLILLGASNTRDAIWPEVLTTPPGWKYHNLGISGATISSLRLLL